MSLVDLTRRSHSSIEVSFAAPVAFNRTLTMEWLNDRQRVQKYAIEAWTGGACTTAAAAQAIGHYKWIYPDGRVRLKILFRLKILSSTDAAAIREFQGYRVDQRAVKSRRVISRVRRR